MYHIFNDVLDGGNNIRMRNLTGCDIGVNQTLDDCDETCPQYHSCYAVALANDVLVAYEKLKPFEISADGGQSWTSQLMTYEEARNEYRMGRIIRHCVLQRCNVCRALFCIMYDSRGTYEYMTDVCDCEAEFSLYDDNEMSLSEFMNWFKEG